MFCTSALGAGYGSNASVSVSVGVGTAAVQWRNLQHVLSRQCVV